MVAESFIPFTYKVYWIGIIFLLTLLLFYFIINYKREKKKIKLSPLLTFFLLFLAVSLYILEQGKVFIGYFDPVKGFVAGYHEPNHIGFLRFVYKLGSGIALAIYGVTTQAQRLKRCKEDRTGHDHRLGH